MNNDELLEKIEKLISPINQRLDTIEAGQTRIEKKLDESIQANAEFFNHAGVFFDLIKNDLDKRIQFIEETLGLDQPPHKN